VVRSNCPLGTIYVIMLLNSIMAERKIKTCGIFRFFIYNVLFTFLVFINFSAS
jgi:hypothetical protein